MTIIADPLYYYNKIESPHHLCASKINSMLIGEVGDAVGCNDDCYALLPLKYCGKRMWWWGDALRYTNLCESLFGVKPCFNYLLVFTKWTLSHSLRYSYKLFMLLREELIFMSDMCILLLVVVLLLFYALLRCLLHTLD